MSTHAIFSICKLMFILCKSSAMIHTVLYIHTVFYLGLTLQYRAVSENDKISFINKAADKM